VLLEIDEYGRQIGDDCGSDIWYTKSGHQVLSNVQGIGNPFQLVPFDRLPIEPQPVCQYAFEDEDGTLVPTVPHIWWCHPEIELHIPTRVRVPKVGGRRLTLSRLLFPGGVKAAQTMLRLLPARVGYLDADGNHRVLLKQPSICHNRLCDSCNTCVRGLIPMYTDVLDKESVRGLDYLLADKQEYDICAFCAAGESPSFEDVLK
jgi:hypothetical protein